MTEDERPDERTGLRFVGGNLVRLGVRVPDASGRATRGPGLGSIGSAAAEVEAFLQDHGAEVQANYESNKAQYKEEEQARKRLASLIETGATMVVKRMTKEFSEQLALRCTGVGTA